MEVAVADADLARALARDQRVVGDDQDRDSLLRVQAQQQRHHFERGVGIQGAGGLVGKQQCRLSGQGPGNGDALFLAAGELAGPMAGPVSHAHARQQRERARPQLRARNAAIYQGQADVLQGRQLRQQLEGLEYKADVFVAQGR